MISLAGYISEMKQKTSMNWQDVESRRWIDKMLNQEGYNFEIFLCMLLKLNNNLQNRTEKECFNLPHVLVLFGVNRKSTNVITFLQIHVRVLFSCGNFKNRFGCSFSFKDTSVDKLIDWFNICIQSFLQHVLWSNTCPSEICIRYVSYTSCSVIVGALPSPWCL